MVKLQEWNWPTPVRVGKHYVCACCPRRPKKFETQEEWEAHESEKRYACEYCHTRFKNKSEAERHENSLHLRDYSWSCAALAKPQSAFGPSGVGDSNDDVSTDACGYCGEEFSNHPSPADWKRRLEHLTNIHKFGQCDSAKTFFRSDHFRQHLKHCHASRTGSWTNTLEDACLRTEVSNEGGVVTSGGVSKTTHLVPESSPAPYTVKERGSLSFILEKPTVA